MDRMRFVPGKEAKDEIYKAAGHVFFDRKTAADFARAFILEAPMGCGGPLMLVYQTMLACLSEGDRVDVWFGLRNVLPEQGEEEAASGELVGHAWAVLRSAAGAERALWEVGRATPPLTHAHAARAFNAYRLTLAAFLGSPAPPPLPVERPAAADVAVFNGRPVISRALSPSNLYYSAGRTWYFVDLCPPGNIENPAILSRPMRAFDALILSTLMTLAMGSPPLVFGISNHLDALGRMPVGFTRVHYEADKRNEPKADRPILVL